MNQILKSAAASRRSQLLALLLGLTLTRVIDPNPVQAITNGIEDGDDHPYVGLVVFYDADNIPVWRCTGTLIAPQVFLTAGHCAIAPAAWARIYFAPHVVRGQGYPFAGADAEGKPFANPEFAATWGGSVIQPVLHDVAVVELTTAVEMATYGQLPEVGVLDTFTGPEYKNMTFDVVGYGVQDMRPEVQADLTRYQASSKRVTGHSAVTGDNYIQLSSDPGKGNGSGGICFGDSGGPTFLKGSNIIVGVNSWVTDGNCAAPGFAYRTDIAESLGFLDPFLD